MADVVAGYLEVGTDGSGNVVINHPQIDVDTEGVGHLVFSPMQAQALSRTLLAKARLARKEVRALKSTAYLQRKTTLRSPKVQSDPAPET